MRDVLNQKLADSLAAQPPTLTRRDIRLPAIRNKALAVIGMRRSGKSTFLWQCLADRLAAGTPREDLVYISFEDDRLSGMQTADLAWLLAEAAGQPPALIQVCLDTSTPATWEREVRALSAAAAEIPGSSALLLTMDSTPPRPVLPAPLQWRPASAWLLDPFHG